MKLKSEESRITWVDSAKGIGILSVVVGHIAIGDVTRYIFLFHMPLFFFLGGFLHKPSSDIRLFFSKKSVQLLVPYVCFLFLIYVPQETILLLGGKESISKAFVRPIWGGTLLISWAGVFWFVTCFFIVQQVANRMLVSMSKYNIFLLSLLSLMLSYINQYFLPGINLPWGANIVLAALPIYLSGYYFKDINLSIGHKFWICVLFILVILYTIENPDNTYVMKNGQYGLPIITVLCSLIVILFIITVAQVFTLGPAWIDSIVSYLGKNSMVIMYIHQPTQYLIKDYFFIESPLVRIALSIVVSLFLGFFFNKNRFTKILFLGDYNEFKNLVLIKDQKTPC